MDLVLVNPNNRTPAPFSAIELPLWLGLIAGSHKGSVAVVDAEAEGLTVEETVKRVEVLQPKKTLIVCMGANPSVSSTPKWPVTEELLKHIDADVTGIHPIAMKRPGAWVVLQGTPSIPWKLFPMDKYRAHNWHCLDDVDKRSPYVVLYTSLNCPFNCYYCNVHTLYYDRNQRLRPRMDIYKDLAYFADKGIRNVKIWDELFCLHNGRVEDFCDVIIANEYDFNFWAYARTDTITPKMLSKMKKAGINWLAYGFESSADKKCVKAEEAIKMTRDAGISIMGNFMFGLPNETMDTMKASLDMAIRENFEYVNFYVALPYPGSQWYADLKVKPTDWSSFSQFSPNICAAPEVVQFRDEAFKTYFNRPEYLSMIKAKFGDKAENHIKEMLAWELR